jgi:hypothetical protein
MRRERKNQSVSKEKERPELKRALHWWMNLKSFAETYKES